MKFFLSLLALIQFALNMWFVLQLEKRNRVINELRATNAVWKKLFYDLINKVKSK